MNNLSSLKAIVMMATNYYCNLIPEKSIEKPSENRTNIGDLRKKSVCFEVKELPNEDELENFFEDKLKSAIDELAAHTLIDINSKPYQKILFLRADYPAPFLSVEQVDPVQNAILRGTVGHIFASSKSILDISISYSLLTEENLNG